jgi:hypothetical protein
MYLGFYNIVSPANERDDPKAIVETHCIARWVTDCVNNALFHTVWISVCKQIPEMISLPAEALERMIPPLNFALPYPKSNKIEK